MNVIIIDDHPLARKGIFSILSDDKSINNITEAANSKEAITIIEKEKPDIAMVDLRLGAEDGLDVITKGKRISSETKFIILTSFITREEFICAEKIGVDGFLLKDAFSDDILYAINLVMRGKKYYAPEIIRYKDRSDNDKLIGQLTDRENEVLKELGKGLSNEEIAKQLFITENTVKKHVSSILSKFNINNRTQVVALINNKLSM